ncbi:ABC transporter substrate-binding protein [Xylophilus rhododendri]|uniref:ABC transporter substrate-binding protein n=1 Tax=Xylophilus rhododendri TaxID=2697032 RepID=A0A857J9E3_9BURK|nr:ABC transporter substrate-binding protein [Xylophilus rhododendri]QHJ00615.1 ABC transporter substrate-binding protein [Xylophilus rhododendri]
MKFKTAAASSCLLALAGLAQAQAPARPLRVQINSDIRSTDPGTNRDDNTDSVLMHIGEGLVAMREDTSPGPLLASKVDVSADGLSYTFTLRDGVKFQNDAPLTAQDVVWSWKRYMDPATNWRCLPEFDGRGMTKLLSVEASDAKTVVFKLQRPAGLLLQTMARSDCGGSAILHSSSVGPDGKWLQPVGTGPYKLKEWKRGQYIDLVRFDGYASRGGPRDGFTGGKKAEIETIHYMVIPDAAAAKAALYSGAIDVLSTASAPDVAEMRARSDVKVEFGPSMNLLGLLFQTRDPLLQDLRLRRALALSLDYDELARSVTEGLSKPNNSPVPTSSPYYGAAEAAGFRRDLPQARKLLAEAGYNGQPIKLLANKRYEISFNSAVLIQAMAADAGIKIDIEVLDWATQLDRYTRGQYQAMAFPYSSRLDPALSFEMLAGPKATQPRKVWDNPAMAGKLAESMLLTDKAARQTLFDELHRKFIEEVPSVVLFNGTDGAGLRKNVSGYQSWPADKPRFWNVSLK